MLGQEKKDGYAGDFVLKNQKTSEAEGFKNVSAMWLDKCIDYDTAMDKIVDGQNKIQDIRGGLQDFTPAVSESGEAVLKYKDGREFIPTDHALKNIAVAGRTSDWFLRDLRTPFGGSKQSGIGREGGVHSLEFYTEMRNVCLKL